MKTKIFFLFGLTGWLLFTNGCRVQNPATDGSQAADGNLRAIQYPNAQEESVGFAIGQLGAVTEPASFWTDIANSPRYSMEHRRACIVALFRRHVHAGMTLNEIAAKLDNQIWLQKEDIHEITSMAGSLPVRSVLSDTTVGITIFQHEKQKWATPLIYLRFAGRSVGSTDIYNALKGEMVSKDVGGTKLNEIGFTI
jgi:hypothetical protein